MPRLSDSMEEGTILKWLKSDGDEVKRGEELVEIETDKANMTYEADADGVLQIVAEEGDTLPVGEVIARIGEGAAGDEGAGEKSRKQKESEGRDEAEERSRTRTRLRRGGGSGRGGGAGRGGGSREGGSAPARAEQPAPASPTADGDGRVKASPVARRMAREMGVELASLQGSGPGGRIVKSDVEAAGRRRAGARAARRRRPPSAREPEPAAPDPRRSRRRRRRARPRQRPDGEGRRGGARALPPPADHRAAHGGVQGDRARLPAPGADRHGALRGAARRAQGRPARATSSRPSTTSS